ncbi:unnamed protein product, partial [Iphiclides podalirius]
MEKLHGKLTSSCYKRYPGQIEVYHNIVKDIKTYNVSVVPSKILPASLHLIDDYIVENKLKGLECCLSVLNCLNEEHFHEGNYYEVIYLTLKKVMSEKDIQVTNLAFQCLTALYDNIPTADKHKKLDDMFATVLDELYMESNLYRKSECLKFTRTIISIHKVNCANSSIFQTIIADNLDLCCNEAVSEILLHITLLTLKEWIKYCWCIWEFSAGQKILSNLLKILYCCNDVLFLE